MQAIADQKPVGNNRSGGADLYWLAFLLTGRREIAIDVAVDGLNPGDSTPFLAAWMGSWARRIAIAKALTAIRRELAESATVIAAARLPKSAASIARWSLPPTASKAQLEDALLALDVFPRAAVVLSVLEGLRLPDAAVLLDVSPELLRKAVAIGLSELTAYLAGRTRATPAGNRPVLSLVPANS